MTKKEVSAYLQQKKDQPLKVTVLRNGRELKEMTPRLETGTVYLTPGLLPDPPGRGR